GSLFEREIHNSLTTDTHYIKAGGSSIAIVTSTSDNNHSVNYLHKDHLGSITSITDHLGLVIESQSYDPHGKRRNNDWTDISGPTPTSATTDRGFTGHEHIDEVGLVHMNGRVYDPTLGRFISADPFVQFPLNAQSLNRYSYVMNNPLSFTDPSGFFFKKLFKGIKKAIKSLLKNKIVRLVASIAAAYFTGVAAFELFGSNIIAGAAGGFAGGLVGSGGNLKTALIGGLTGAAAGFIGGSTAFGEIASESFNGITLGRVVAHGVVGGAASIAQGGKFLQGFISSAFVKSISGRIQAITKNVGSIAGGVVAAVAGGAASVLGGGKFANGAMTAGFQYLFNQAAGTLSRKNISSMSVEEKKAFAAGQAALVEEFKESSGIGQSNVDLSRTDVQKLGVVISVSGIILGPEVTAVGLVISGLAAKNPEDYGWLALDVVTLKGGTLLRGTIAHGLDDSVSVISGVTQLNEIQDQERRSVNCQPPLKC
ncbi:MAG: hypothetical protein COB23_07085, partial [Methylophaga sp.]